jgi:CrcB protein
VDAKSVPMNSGLNFLCVGVGGAAGACLRYALSLMLARELWRFPAATLIANLTGAFLAGVIVTWFWNRGASGTPVQHLLIVGFLGGFTTFSAFSVETLRLAQSGSEWLALLNIVANVCGSLLAVYAGASLVR